MTYVWVVTSEFNEYDEHLLRFVAAFSTMERMFAFVTMRRAAIKEAEEMLRAYAERTGDGIFGVLEDICQGGGSGTKHMSIEEREQIRKAAKRGDPEYKGESYEDKGDHIKRHSLVVTRVRMDPSDWSDVNRAAHATSEEP